MSVPPIDVALKFVAEHGAEIEALGRRRRWLVGSPAMVKEGIEATAAEYGAEEVMVVTITYDHGARKRSYELLAKALLDRS